MYEFLVILAVGDDGGQLRYWAHASNIYDAINAAETFVKDKYGDDVYLNQAWLKRVVM